MCLCQLNLSIPITDEQRCENTRRKNVILVCSQGRKETHVTFSSSAPLCLIHILLPTILQERLRGLLIKTEMSVIFYNSARYISEI